VFALVLLGGLAFAQKTPQEQQLFQQLNESRKEAGLPALEWDERLAQAAREHTRQMIDANKLAHVVNGEAEVGERLAATGIRFNRSGENVGYNTDFNDIQHAWMESPGHRENILSPNYNVVGIGVQRSDDGLYYATQDFAHALPQRSAEQADNLVAESVAKLRSQANRLPLEKIKGVGLNNLACGMAKTGKLDPEAAIRLPNVREAVVYNNSRPEILPESAKKILRKSELTQFAVSACFTGDQPSNPGGTFYVVLAFY